MNEIIKIQTSKGGKQVVSARELYEFLGITTDFTTWCKRMFEYGFTENTDYALIKIGESNSQPLVKSDYILTVDCAKEISMLQRTDKGKEARLYFIACEKMVNMTAYSLPVTFADALRQLADKEEEKEMMQKQLEAQRPAVDFYNTVANTDDTFDMLTVAKVVGFKGRTLLFKMLKDRKILMKNNLPYQQYIDNKTFKTVEVPFTKPNGKECVGLKTVVYQKGIDLIIKLNKKI